MDLCGDRATARNLATLASFPAPHESGPALRGCWTLAIKKAAKKRCPSCGNTFPADTEHFFYFPFSQDKLTTRCVECTIRYQVQHAEDLEGIVYRFLSRDAEIIRSGKPIARVMRKSIKSLQARAAKDRANNGYAEWFERATGSSVALGIRHFMRAVANSQQGLDSIVSGSMRAALRAKFAGLEPNPESLAWEKWTRYSLDALAERLTSQFTPDMTVNTFISGQIHIDHVKPRVAFHYTSFNQEAFRKCWALDNLQPLWAIDNLKKGSKWQGETIRRKNSIPVI